MIEKWTTALRLSGNDWYYGLLKLFTNVLETKNLYLILSNKYLSD